MTTTPSSTPTEAEQRAASMARHPAGRRTIARALVTLAAAGLVTGATSVVVAAPASAATQCTADPLRCDDPHDVGYLGPFAYGDGSVTRNGGHFTFWQLARGLENAVFDAFGWHKK